MTQANYSQDEITEVIAALLEKTTNRMKLEQLKKKEEDIKKQRQKMQEKERNTQQVNPVENLRNNLEDEKRMNDIINEYKGKSDKSMMQLLKDKINNLRNYSIQIVNKNKEISEKETLGKALLKLDKDIKLMQTAKDHLEDQFKQVYKDEIKKIFGDQEKDHLKNDIIKAFSRSYYAQLNNQKESDKQILKHVNDLKESDVVNDKDIEISRLKGLNTAIDKVREEKEMTDAEKIDLNIKYDAIQSKIEKGETVSTIPFIKEKNLQTNNDSIQNLNKHLDDLNKKTNKMMDRQEQLDKILQTDFSKQIVSQIQKNEVLLSSLDQYVKNAATSQIQNLQKDVSSFKKALTPQESQKYNSRIQNIEDNLNKSYEKTMDLKEESTEKKMEEKDKEMEKSPSRSKAYDMSLER
ncbi:hypothetical protein [Bacillus taeanensis]|uniref:Uncharacterized protein n=1 Tax=Bacillus taeanensis TaxID=273032 RepID=A0A366XVR7_9BACI|nr:hypothetical protein [Bacillus taeanensis]RBW68234.1 hypothetical protein DS031_17820 [Bacillus taeanensis]